MGRCDDWRHEDKTSPKKRIKMEEDVTTNTTETTKTKFLPVALSVKGTIFLWKYTLGFSVLGTLFI
jgi:hypothetical protein